jgi:hypothetical protein
VPPQQRQHRLHLLDPRQPLQHRAPRPRHALFGRAPALGEDPRPERRAATAVVAEVDPGISTDPVEPPDPVVSANAIGIAATAEPIPNANANAPTRPT